MFQSFTGNSRRPRQVNLSGRATNPFVAFPGNPQTRQTPHVANPESAVAIAQRERALRQHERDRQTASRTVQRVWRGYQSRKRTYKGWKSEWDTFEWNRVTSALGLDDDRGPMTELERLECLARLSAPPYPTAEQCLDQLRLLVQFVGLVRNKEDVLRLVYFCNVFEETFHFLPTIATENDWTELLKRLAVAILHALGSSRDSPTHDAAVLPLLRTIVFLVDLIPKKMATIAQQYYETMALLTKNIGLFGGTPSPEHVTNAVLALLRPITSETMAAYEALAMSYLTIPNLPAYLGELDGLAHKINYKLLAPAIESCIPMTKERLSTDDVEGIEGRLWLLAYLIFFHRYALPGQANLQAPDLAFLNVVSGLLNSTSIYLTRCFEVDENGLDPVRAPCLDQFVADQVSSLVNQSSITGLLSRIRTFHLSHTDVSNNEYNASKEAKILATYALNLLRVFPRRGDDIRMWLYLGSAPSAGLTAGEPGAKIPAIKYFWQASKSSQIFHTISKDSTQVLPLLQLPQGGDTEDQEQEWTIILLFFELYTFLLKVMDDEEFFSSASPYAASPNVLSSWTKESALPLQDIKDMTIFLKNLAFTLYWNIADLTKKGPVLSSAVDLRSYFNNTTQVSGSIDRTEVEAKKEINDLPGVIGIPLDYFKGLVTGLLRMLHERDSRRKFLPQNHWLMTDRFDMEGFIPAVVAEEEKRHEFQDDDEESEPDLLDAEYREPSPLVGNSHARRLIQIQAMRNSQRRQAHNNALAAIAPRLEILRNMPFFIPFATRVQIFRQFIFRDQQRRRKGFVDPESWRLSVAQNAMINGPPEGAADILARHHADIRRESVFEDAFSQYYGLGDGLKEPIQISFIDQFGAMEAGIDGGGVTKEFLTSITSQAFKTDDYESMFAENDHHLLYPSPIAVDQLKKVLSEAGLTNSSPEWQDDVRGLLRRYEFLGRIIGKCLYEGILVDVDFAPFFLLKWALTGGSRSAVKESSYRANLNDLKDLDEGLYQGLLQLKNYPGNVEDFGLDFTINNKIRMPSGANRTVTAELKPNGSQTAVTNKNRLVYISYVARYRLQLQPALQTNAFLQGLGQIVQPAWLSMFNQSELQTLVSGDKADIDVEDLRRNTLYGGVYVIGDDNLEHPTIALFWQVMHEMTNEERQKVIRFVTSTPRAPLLGFSHLRPNFSIRDSSEDQERLPSTSTCVNLLKLPRYSDADTLRSKLLYAVSSGAGFDLS
ncbi:hypothetical protein PDIG_51580 [Penicillium digitatum PHI26]|uniref:HECT-type E3 ubiquitin transferase n=2 Tax=Penicillium digitatum TaxID=36651 RepID=K9GDI5_PEND2|nr:hypothetical protein PDIP_20780 [Penicillium digitatum Pd1]EKV11321.1 hypothetical protein PDIG_51580 [Penicillium digitatum PHI26]EKV19921.1 hypothetical protein PDIP_20780 [Penicillium digitatum Pd1]KAG0153270.1 hypothetical protein PDIDSM_5120 [Penicillium digitatum]